MIDRAATGSQLGKRLWYVLIAIQTRYLLDQVGLSSQIRAACRRHNFEAVVEDGALDFKAKRGEEPFNFILRNCYAEQFLDTSLTQQYRWRHDRFRVQIQKFRQHSATRQLCDE